MKGKSLSYCSQVSPFNCHAYLSPGLIKIGCLLFAFLIEFLALHMIWTAHSTVATVVEQDGKFLMVEEIDNGCTVFNQPAGHLDEGETLFTAAIRETLEETAWHVTLTAFLGNYVYKAPNGLTYVRHCFIATPDSHDATLPLDEGIIAAHWLGTETIFSDNFAPRSPLVGKAIEDYLGGQRMPLDVIQHFI